MANGTISAPYFYFVMAKRSAPRQPPPRHCGERRDAAIHTAASFPERQGNPQDRMDGYRDASFAMTGLCFMGKPLCVKTLNSFRGSSMIRNGFYPKFLSL
jgi:hypothetical protein